MRPELGDGSKVHSLYFDSGKQTEIAMTFQRGHSQYANLFHDWLRNIETVFRSDVKCLVMFRSFLDQFARSFLQHARIYSLIRLMWGSGPYVSSSILLIFTLILSKHEMLLSKKYASSSMSICIFIKQAILIRWLVNVHAGYSVALRKCYLRIYHLE